MVKPIGGGLIREIPLQKEAIHLPTHLRRQGRSVNDKGPEIKWHDENIDVRNDIHMASLNGAAMARRDALMLEHIVKESTADEIETTQWPFTFYKLNLKEKNPIKTLKPLLN